MEELSLSNIEKQKKELQGILRYLDSKPQRVHVPNLIFDFKELKLPNELFLDAIQIGLSDAIAIIQTDSSPGTAGHWPDTIAFVYATDVRPIIPKESNLIILGDALTKLIARLNELWGRSKMAASFYKKIGMIEKSTELQSKIITSEDADIIPENEVPEWQMAVEEFFETIKPCTITSEQRNKSVQNIKEAVEEEIGKLK